MPTRTILTLVAALGVAMSPLTGYAGPASAASAAASVDFVTPDFAPTGGVLPEHTATGDFNGDGRLDAITVNQGPTPLFGTGIGVSLGAGTGRLGRTVTTDVGDGYGACDLAVGNWNGDAMDDVVVIGCVTSGPGNVVAFVATGDGHFTKTQSWAGRDVQLVAADFNGDGKDDFATSQRGSAEVRSYLGKGNGTFQPAVVVSPSFDSYDLEVADVDNDQVPDLVGAAGGPVWTMLGVGDGTFGAQRFQFSEVLSGLELAVADLDNDGTVDVAVVDASGGHVGIGLGTGDGHFVPGDQITLGTLQAVWVAPGQVTADGNVDLVAGLDNSSTVSALLPGHGDGHFAKVTHWVVGADGLSTGDFDADGRTDLVAFTRATTDGRVYVSLARGKGFRAPALTRGPNSEDIVDVNGDGAPDKVSGTTGLLHGSLSSQVIVQLGDGRGKFGKQIISHIRAETAASGVGDIDVADINEDDIPDVVGGFDNFQPSPNNLFWMLGKGDGSFKRPTLSTTGDANADVLALAAADVNGDGHVDIVANTLSQLSVRLGTGTGSFGSPLTSGVGSGADRAVLVDDFTGDGIVDVVTTVRTGDEDFGSGEIRLQKGSGTGSFSLLQTQAVDSNLSSGVKADLNDDGRPDVVTAGSRGFNGGRNALWVLLTTPSGMLGTQTPYAGPTGQVATGDVDLDGDLDIATTGNATVDFYLNDGSGLFPKVVDIIAAGGLGTVADLNQDGAPDVISGSPFGEFAVHLNAR